MFGKILIAIGVDWLDMTPFGWRFMNAVVIALFPLLLWAAARWMFGTRFAAYSAAFLAFFELMFFVHGRWANIDAFLAFFLTGCLVVPVIDAKGEVRAVYGTKINLLAATDPRGETASRLVKYLLNNRRHATYWHSTRDTAVVIDLLSNDTDAESDPLTFQTIAQTMALPRLVMTTVVDPSCIDCRG